MGSHRHCGISPMATEIDLKIKLGQCKSKRVKGIKGRTEVEIEFVVLPFDHLQARTFLVNDIVVSGIAVANDELCILARAFEATPSKVQNLLAIGLLVGSPHFNSHAFASKDTHTGMSGLAALDQIPGLAHLLVVDRSYNEWRSLFRNLIGWIIKR